MLISEGGDEVLDSRKLQILMSIIDAHINNAEPVGSRTLTKFYDLGVSSATIRNEMADLEDMGLLIKPHPSSGRIPSDKAYRLYVNNLMETKREVDKKLIKVIAQALEEEKKKQGDFLSYAVKLLSHLTNYTSMLVLPGTGQLTIKYVNLSPIDDKELLFTVLSDQGIAKNNIIPNVVKMESEEIFKFNEILNNILSGKKFSEVDKVLRDAASYLKEYEDLIPIILPSLKESNVEEVDKDIQYSGITNILDYPEYQNLGKAKSLINFLENRVDLLKLLDDDSDNNINIYIGSENLYEEIQECTIITASYVSDGDSIGKIGIIGPTRMDYPKLLAIFRLFYSTINDGTNII